MIENSHYFFIDINRFNLINDTLGHKAGDIVLREVATRLQSCIPQDTPLARIGGDEFTILIRNATDKESLLDLCNELIHTVKKPMQVHNHTYHLSLSIGIVSRSRNRYYFTTPTRRYSNA